PRRRDDVVTVRPQPPGAVSQLREVFLSEPRCLIEDGVDNDIRQALLWNLNHHLDVVNLDSEFVEVPDMLLRDAGDPAVQRLAVIAAQFQTRIPGQPQDRLAGVGRVRARRAGRRHGLLACDGGSAQPLWRAKIGWAASVRHRGSWLGSIRLLWHQFQRFAQTARLAADGAYWRVGVENHAQQHAIRDDHAEQHKLPQVRQGDEAAQRVVIGRAGGPCRFDSV